jgi:hypothetical protein
MQLNTPKSINPALLAASYNNGLVYGRFIKAKECLSLSIESTQVSSVELYSYVAIQEPTAWHSALS